MRTAFLSLACVAAPVAACAALEGARYQVALHPVSGWAKVCSKDKATGKAVCYTSRNYGTDKRKPPVLDLAVYDIEGDATHVVRFLMPVGLRTDVGLAFSVDGGDKQAGLFKTCDPNGCFAEVKFGMPVLASMKKGGTLQITTKDGKNRRVDFYVSLDGFAAAYDGAGAAYRPVPPRRDGPPQRPGQPHSVGTEI